MAGKLPQIAHYRVLEILGSGAMGVVYRATDPRMFGRTVALKVLSDRLSSDPQALERFRREIQVIARLQHPNIVTLYDWGEYDDRPYFAMEHIEGTDLTEVIREPEGRSLEQKLQIARQVCDGLAFAQAACGEGEAAAAGRRSR